MAADFSLQFPCAVRQAIPEAQLVHLVKHRVIAQFAATAFRDAHPELDRETIFNECKVELRVTGPDGVAKEMPVTVGQLFSATAQLDEFRGHCQECRANIADRPFGCIGKINYPITAVAERWLTSRLPDDPRSPSLSKLFKFAGDLGVDGAHVDELRTRVSMFELKAPATGAWGTGPERKQISSSQLLQMLLFGGDIWAQQAQLYTHLLGLETILSERHPQSDQVEQFKTFFCGVVMAGRLNCTLSVEA